MLVCLSYIIEPYAQKFFLYIFNQQNIQVCIHLTRIYIFYQAKDKC